MHSPIDLKIVLLTNKENEYKWNAVKLMPHLFSEDKTQRYFATNEDEAKEIFKSLEEVYNERNANIKAQTDENKETNQENPYLDYKPYYIIITDDFGRYKNLAFLDEVIEAKLNLGFSFLMVDKSLKHLPNTCNKYIYVVDKVSCIFEKEYTSQNQLNFNVEYCNGLDMYRAARELSNIPIQSAEASANLPSSISFLEMYNVGNIEQLGILNRWKSSDPITTLSCPIGVHSSGDLFKLDLHEKYHGPHGLIAGSTGSGKSEFIITYILSMAVNYHPDEVQFVLIDYKGGGLAGAFENQNLGIKLPHLVGTITNIDTVGLQRSLASIQSELKRRQVMFNEARNRIDEGTIDIYKYQKLYHEGIVEEPIPHLLIICDEFAELKQQQEEFMDELISVARIGRSLGVHLILATQKPAGIVNEQIRSNSKFGICLKVQSTEDSTDVINRPDAAYLKRAGQFYMQVGNNEYFTLGLSAYSGLPYMPSDVTKKKINNSLEIISNIGTVLKEVSNSKQVKLDNKGEQLTNIVKYMYKLAKQENIESKQLWMDNIPETIFLENTREKYKIEKIELEKQCESIEPLEVRIENVKQAYITLRKVIEEYHDIKMYDMCLANILYDKNTNSFRLIDTSRWYPSNNAFSKNIEQFNNCLCYSLFRHNLDWISKLSSEKELRELAKLVKLYENYLANNFPNFAELLDIVSYEIGKKSDKKVKTIGDLSGYQDKFKKKS